MFVDIFSTNDICEGGSNTARVNWWESIWLWLGLAFLSVLPFTVTNYPPITDLYSHIGRYYILLNYDHSALLQKYYIVHWSLIPNLGQDLLMMPLGRLIGVERGAIFLTSMIPPAMVLGIRQLSLKAHGRVQPTAFLALLFVYSYTFIYGFLNYHMGVALLLWLMVMWLSLEHLPPSRRVIILTLLSPLIWLVHMAAWALFLLGIGTFELVYWIRRCGWNPAQFVPKVALCVIWLLLPILLSIGAPPSKNPIVFPTLSQLKLKGIWLAFTLRDESRLLDLATLAIIFIVPIVLLWRRQFRCDIRFFLFSGLCFILYWLIPSAMMNGYYADLRLTPVICIFVFLAVRIPYAAKSRRNEWIVQAVVILGLALFLLRLGITSYHWAERGKQLAADMKALDFIPRGARIATGSQLRNCKRWESSGIDHIASLAIVRREVFTTSEWDIPGQQLMQPIYGRGTAYNGPAGLKLRANDGKKCGNITIKRWLDGVPRERFDYVWIFGIPAELQARDWLELKFAGPSGRLYAIRH